MHLPQVVKESQGKLFAFHHNGKICQGLVLDQQIYRHLMTVTSRRNLEVIYACCCQLARRGVDVVVTIGSDNVYQVWVDLRHGEKISPILPVDEVEPIEVPEIVISPARQPLPVPKQPPHRPPGFPPSARAVRSSQSTRPHLD